MTSRSHSSYRRGFTLVEMLVVIAIIGILAAILVPVAGIVITRGKEAKITIEVKQMSMAVESYKNEFGVYPIDMSNPLLLRAHVNQISRRHKHEAGPNQLLFDPTNPTNPATWYGANLPNPRSNEPGQPQFRRPFNMDRAEALVFFMHEINNNKDYPLGYRQPDPINQPNLWAPVSGDHYHFIELTDTQLRDYDNDGWQEYVQAAGPEIPMVYFDSRSNLRPDFRQYPNPSDWNNTNNFTANNMDTWADDDAQVLSNWPRVRGVPQPYWAEWDRTDPRYIGWPTKFTDGERFQIITAGMDGDFGTEYARQQPTAKQHDAGPKNYFMSRGELDGMTSFSDGRLDKDYEQ